MYPSPICLIVSDRQSRRTIDFYHLTEQPAGCVVPIVAGFRSKLGVDPNGPGPGRSAVMDGDDALFDLWKKCYP